MKITVFINNNLISSFPTVKSLNSLNPTFASINEYTILIFVYFKLYKTHNALIFLVTIFKRFSVRRYVGDLFGIKTYF